MEGGRRGRRKGSFLHSCGSLSVLLSVGELCSLYLILSQHVVASYDIVQRKERGREICVIGYTRKCYNIG